MKDWFDMFFMMVIPLGVGALLGNPIPEAIFGFIAIVLIWGTIRFWKIFCILRKFKWATRLINLVAMVLIFFGAMVQFSDKWSNKDIAAGIGSLGIFLIIIISIIKHWYEDEDEERKTIVIKNPSSSKE